MTRLLVTDHVDGVATQVQGSWWTVNAATKQYAKINRVSDRYATAILERRTIYKGRVGTFGHRIRVRVINCGYDALMSFADIEVDSPIYTPGVPTVPGEPADVEPKTTIVKEAAGPFDPLAYIKENQALLIGIVVVLFLIKR